MQPEVGKSYLDGIGREFVVLSVNPLEDKVWIRYKSEFLGTTYRNVSEFLAGIFKPVNDEKENTLMIPSPKMDDYYLNIQNYDEILKCYDSSEKNVYLLNREGKMFHIRKEDFYKKYVRFSIETYFNKKIVDKKPEIVIENPKKEVIAPFIKNTVDNLKQTIPANKYKIPTVGLVKDFKRMSLSIEFTKEYVGDRKYVELGLRDYCGGRHVFVMRFTNIKSSKTYNITKNKSVTQIHVAGALKGIRDQIKYYKFTQFIVVKIGNDIQVSFDIVKGK